MVFSMDLVVWFK